MRLLVKPKWKSGLEAKGLKMNTGKTKVMFSCSMKVKVEEKGNPTFTLNALLSPSVVLTTVCAPSHIAMTAFTIHSSSPAFLRAHLVTSLGTLSNAFSKSTK